MQKLVFRNANGIELDLTTDPFGITEWEGFSADELNIQSQQVPFQDGGVFLDALLGERELAVTVAMNDGNDLEKRYRLRRQMISALNPKLGEGVLIYTNDFLSKQIHVIPQLPVFENHNSNDSGTPKVNCVFTACNPYWEDLEETVVNFGIGEQPVIDNDGDIPAQMEIEFLTEGVENPMITRLNEQKSIKFEGELKNNLYINTNKGNKTVTKQIMNFNLIQKFSDNVKGIRYLNDKYIILYYNALLYSYDGVNFDYCHIDLSNSEYTPLILDLKEATYSEELGIYVAVGGAYNVTLLYSYDGINWIYVPSYLTSGNSYLNDVTYSKKLGLFLAVGAKFQGSSDLYGLTAISSDGINWNWTLTEEDQEYNSVVYSEEKELFVATTGRLTNNILKSSDAINWTAQSINASLRDIIYTKSNFIVVGDSGKIFKSSDATNWTEMTSNTNKELKKICYSSALDIVLIVGTNIIIKSSDLQEWYSEEININFSCVDYSEEKGLFLCKGTINNNNKLFHSSNGTIWEENDINTNENDGQDTIIYVKEKNQFLRITLNNTLGVSYDGIKWEYYSIPENYSRKICYSKKLDKYIILCPDNVYISTNLNDWETYSVEINFGCNDLIYSELFEKFIGVASNKLVTSVDGINWNIETYENYLLNDIAESKKLGKIVISASSKMLYTTDGENWNTVIISNGYLRKITCSDDGTFIAVGATFSPDYGLIQKSIDGINWELKVNDVQGAITDVVYSERLKLFVAIGQKCLLTSMNGNNWTQEKMSPLGLTNIIYSEYGNIFLMYRDVIRVQSYIISENAIQDLTQDSDINLNLLTGENKFRLNRDDGTFFATLKYRQKYIGV